MTEQLICARSFTTDWWSWARRGLPPPAPFFLGGCAGEKGGLRTPTRLPLPPVRNPGPKERIRSSSATRWTDYRPTFKARFEARPWKFSCALGEFTHGRRRHGTDNCFTLFENFAYPRSYLGFFSRFYMDATQDALRGMIWSYRICIDPK